MRLWFRERLFPILGCHAVQQCVRRHSWPQIQRLCVHCVCRFEIDSTIFPQVSKNTDSKVTIGCHDPFPFQPLPFIALAMYSIRINFSLGITMQLTYKEAQKRFSSLVWFSSRTGNDEPATRAKYLDKQKRLPGNSKILNCHLGHSLFYTEILMYCTVSKNQFQDIFGSNVKLPPIYTLQVYTCFTGY